MNKQFDLFQKLKIKDVCEDISKMTYAYVQPETNQPTVVPAKHYRDILEQPVEAMVNEQVKKQFLNIMFKQVKALKDEEPSLFYQTMLLLDLNKTPDSLGLNEEIALKMEATSIVEAEKEQKKKFHLVDQEYISGYEDTRDNSELMAKLLNTSDDGIMRS